MADSNSKKSEAQEVQNEINQLNLELADAVDQYNDAAAKLDELNGKIGDNQEHLEQVGKELGKSLRILNKRATGIYKHGDVYSMEIIFGSKSINDFVTRLDLLARVGNRDADIVRQVQEEKRQVEETAKVLDGQYKEQASMTADLEARKDAIDSQLGDKTNVLASILQDVSNMEAEEAQRAAEATRNRGRGGGGRRSGARLVSPISGWSWSDYAPGEWSDHGPSGHGVWLGGDAYDAMCGDGVVIYAAHSGTVTEVGFGRGGYTIISGEGFETCYAHADPYCGTGEFVVAGQPIAMTGSGFGHLHFELIDNGEAIGCGDYQFYF